VGQPPLDNDETYKTSFQARKKEDPMGLKDMKEMVRSKWYQLI